MTEMVRPTRVLVVRIGAMGDVLHALPAVAALRLRLPQVMVGWAVDERWRSLLSGDEPGLVDQMHLAAIRNWKQRPLSPTTGKSLLMLRREMQAKSYDVCVDLQGTMRSAAIGRISGAKRYLGPANPRERLAALLYGERVELRARPVIRQACELMSAAVHKRLAPAAVCIPRGAEAEIWAAEHVGDEPFALLAPTAGWPAKQWPAARYVSLARELHRHGLRVLVNAASEHEPLAREIAEAAPCGRMVCNVAQLVALTRRATLVVGGDSGPVHLAAALGRITVALFGPTDPERNGPDFPGARVRVLRAPESVTSYKRTRQAELGLGLLGVQQVVRAAFELLEAEEHG